MDKVKEFIANNSHQFGYIMHEAARQWAEKCPTGALTVGPCKGTVDVYGSYLELLDKLEAMQNGNVHSCSIEVDTKEADKNVKELTAVANECVEAFEKLEKVMDRFTNKGELKDIQVGIVLDGRVTAKSIIRKINELDEVKRNF